MKVFSPPLKIALGLASSVLLGACNHPGADSAVPGAIVPLEKISPGIDNADWSNSQSKAAWREYERERNIEPHPLMGL